MSLPYFPMYPTDFEADTSHLTLIEDGAFNRLLRLCWMTPGCSIPDDEAWILRRMRARSQDEIEAVQTVLAEFFKRENGRLFSPRLRKEALLSQERHARRVGAGRKGGQSAKALKTNETKSSNAKAMPKQPEPEPDIVKRDTNVSPKKTRGERLSADWKLPREWGEWATSEGWPESIVRDQAERFRDYWLSKPGQAGVKLDWLATWRNWMRNSNAPKIVKGAGYEKPSSKQQDRLNAFIAGARGAP